MHRLTRNRTPEPKETPRPDFDTSSDSIAAEIRPLSVRISAAVKMTGIGRSKLYELIQEGATDIVKIGSSTLIPVESLERLLKRNRR